VARHGRSVPLGSARGWLNEVLGSGAVPSTRLCAMSQRACSTLAIYRIDLLESFCSDITQLTSFDM